MVVKTRRLQRSGSDYTGAPVAVAAGWVAAGAVAVDRERRGLAVQPVGERIAEAFPARRCCLHLECGQSQHSHSTVTAQSLSPPMATPSQMTHTDEHDDAKATTGRSARMGTWAPWGWAHRGLSYRGDRSKSSPSQEPTSVAQRSSWENCPQCVTQAYRNPECCGAPAAIAAVTLPIMAARNPSSA